MTDERETNSRNQKNLPAKRDHYNYQDNNADTIDIAELASVLFKKKWFISGFTLLIICLALSFSLMKENRYIAMTMIEIGALPKNDGYIQVENSTGVKNRLDSLAKAVAGTLSENETDNLLKNSELQTFSIKNNLDIKVPKNGSIATLELTVPKNSKALDFLKGINKKMITAHNRIFDQQRIKINNKIDMHELAVKNIDIKIAKLLNDIQEIKRKYEEKTREKKYLIGKLTSSIETIHSKKTLIQKKKSLLNREKEDLNIRIEDSEKRYEQLVASKLTANFESTSSNAVGLMLFSSEIQHMQNYLSQLRDRFLFVIPAAICEMETALQELKMEKNNKESEKLLEQKRLEQLEPEMKEKIAEIEGLIMEEESKKEEKRIEIKGLENKLNNMIITQVIVPPRFSDKPVPKKLRLHLAAGLAAGFFLSVFLAFVIEFWQKNKGRIKGEK